MSERFLWGPNGGRLAASESGDFLVPKMEPLGVPAQAWQLAAGASSANAVLTASCRRISIHARGADIRFAIGSNAQNASATASHFIAAGERLDLALPATPNIAVIRAGTVDGTLEVMELI